MAKFSVFIALPGSRAAAVIDAGSGVVGTAQGDLLLVDYEGSRYGQHPRYADRVMHAAGRHSTRYPTLARALLEPGEFAEVGYYDDVEGRVFLSILHERLTEWIGHEIDDEELLTTSVRHQMRRDIAAAYASGDPRKRMVAAQLARRYGLDDSVAADEARRR